MSRDSNVFLSLRETVHSNVKNAKSQTLTAVEAFVRSELKSNGLLRRAKDLDLVEHFRGKFSAENFLACFTFMRDYVDVDKSKAKGQWFMRSKIISFVYCYTKSPANN